MNRQILMDQAVQTRIDLVFRLRYDRQRPQRVPDRRTLKNLALINLIAAFDADDGSYRQEKQFLE